jgi:Zn-dependent protease
MTVTPLRTQRGPSLIFLGLLAVLAASGWALWDGFGNARTGVFLFVCSGWVVSLCLHEFGHAFTAYRSGDRGVAARGYLTLNPLKYTDWVLSILLPLIFVVAGGIGFPGGAVWVDRSAIRGGRHRHSLISAIGPIANLMFALVLLLPVALFAPEPVNGFVPAGSHLDFWAALAFLGLLQLIATLLNLLPMPGLDGFGIWEPWLPRHWVYQAQRLAPYGMLILFAILWGTPAGRWLFDGAYHVMDWIGVPSGYAATGHDLFLFWRK